MSLIDNTVNDNLIKVRRGNVILRISAEQKEYYMGLGYNVIDKTGKVIEETVPVDKATLQRFYKDAKEELGRLKAENKALKDEIEALKSQPVAVEPEVVEEPEAIEEEVEIVKPTRRRRKS